MKHDSVSHNRESPEFTKTSWVVTGLLTILATVAFGAVWAKWQMDRDGSVALQRSSERPLESLSRTLPPLPRLEVEPGSSYAEYERASLGENGGETQRRIVRAMQAIAEKNLSSQSPTSQFFPERSQNP